MFVTIDFETFWSSKDYTLSKMGPVEYVRDQRFEAQLVSLVSGLWNGTTQPRVECFEGQRISQMLHVVRAGRLAGGPVVWIGHNLAGFDALVLSEQFGIHPKHMWDTISMMNWTGVSRLVGKSHAKLTEYFGTGVKQAGTVVSDGKHMDEMTPEDRAFFKQYCKDDALQCCKNASLMLPYMTADALQFMSITARMATDPKFVLDQQLIEQYISDLDVAVAQARVDLMQYFHFASEEDFLKSVRSAEKFAGMLRSLGVEPPRKVSEAKTATKKAQLEYMMQTAQTAEEQANVQAMMERDLPVLTYAFSKQDLDFLSLREHPDMRVQMLVNARLEHNSSINRSRAERFLVFARQNRPVPIMLSAFNAHTSRYTAGSGNDEASDRLQFQNLSKRDPGKALLRKAIKAPAGHKVVACDSSQVEARCLAWVAGETGLVEQFRQGRDPYSELAEIIFNVPAADIKAGAKSGDKKMKLYRNVGKTAILSAGYGVGAQKFSDTLLRSGSMMGHSVEEHHELAFHAHAVYRSAHPAIVGFWKLCSNVIRNLLLGYSGSFGGPDGNLFTYGYMPVCGRTQVASIAMPSGYILRYPNLRCEQESGKPVYYYDRQRGKNMATTKIYGGSLTENLIQGFAFQVLMWQACRMDGCGVPLAANIHDSFAAVVSESYADETARIMERCMSEVPPWAQGLPIACEVEIGDDFTVV